MIKDRIILGIDPGTIVMGYGILKIEGNKPKLEAMGILQLNAAKEQVAGMLQRYLKIPDESMLPQLDATDGLAAAVCHYFQTNNPISEKKYTGWKDFIAKNPGKVR